MVYCVMAGCSDACLLSVGQDSLIRAREGLQEQYCFNVNYGSSTCDMHDKNQGVCADATGTPIDNAPLWCARSWCYVDADVCKENDLFYTRFALPPCVMRGLTNRWVSDMPSSRL